MLIDDEEELPGAPITEDEPTSEPEKSETEPENEEPNEEEKPSDNTDDKDKEEDEDFDPLDPEAEDEKKTEDNEELDPESKLAANVKQIETKMFNQRRDSEVALFFASDTGKILKKYESKVRDFAKSPQFKHLKIEAVVGAVVGTRGMMKAGAEIERTRRSKSNASQLGSSRPARPVGGADTLPDFSKMSSAEIEEYNQKVMHGKIKFD